MNTFNTGIYQIVNQVNGKRYIGSAINLKRRKEGHFYELNKQKHINDILQKAYNKYGKNNLKFEILLYCSKENLLFYEQRAIDSYNIKTELYNLCSIAGNTFGRKHSDETKKKIGIKGKNKIITEETKKKMSECQKGKKHTEETKQKMRGKNNPMYGKPGAMKGKKLSEEHKRKIGLAHKGKIVSEKTRKKLSELNIDKNNKPIKAFIYETGELIGEYKSIKECAEKLGIKAYGICHTLSKRQKHHKGYTFEYKPI